MLFGFEPWLVLLNLIVSVVKFVLDSESLFVCHYESVGRAVMLHWYQHLQIQNIQSTFDILNSDISKFTLVSKNTVSTHLQV